MTREEILATYTVGENGIIKTLGKFEGEMLYAPYFYDRVLDGEGEDVYEGVIEPTQLEVCETPLLYTELEVTDEDRAEFPEIGDTARVRISETSQGFVYLEEIV